MVFSLVMAQKDLEAVVELYELSSDYFDSTKNLEGWNTKRYPTAKHAKKAFERKELFIVHLDGQAVGTVTLSEDRPQEYAEVNFEADGGQKILYILLICVSPNFRKLGVGQRIMNFVSQYAQQNQFKAIQTDCSIFNEPVKALYKNSGFYEVGMVDKQLEKKNGIKWYCCFEKIVG